MSEAAKISFLLLRRPPAMFGETWHGYLLRLANANFLKGLKQLAKCMKMSRHAMLSARPDVVLRKLGMLHWYLIDHKRTSRQRQWQGRHKEYASPHRQSKVCPHCFAEDESAYAHHEWDSPIILSCAKHRVLLINACVECSKVIRVDRHDLLICSCGTAFSDMKTAKASRGILQIEETFREQYTRLRSSHEFSGITSLEEEACRVVRWLLYPNNLLLIQQRDSTWTWKDTLSLKESTWLESLFSNWPHNLAAHLMSRPLAPRKNIRSAFAKRLCSEKFQAMEALLDAMEKVAETANSQADKNGLDYRKTTATVSTISHLTGLTPCQVIECLESKTLLDAKVVFDESSGEHKFFLPIGSLKKIKDHLSKTCTAKDAAQRLGCSEKLVHAFLSSGYLPAAEPILLPKNDSIRRIDLCALLGFQDELLKMACLEIPSCGERVYINSWVPSIREKKAFKASSWAECFAAIQSGFLPIYARSSESRAISEIFAYREDLKRVLELV